MKEDDTMITGLSVAEELVVEKQKVSQDRIRKLNQDRKPQHDSNLAQTEGLKVEQTKGRRNTRIEVIDDDFEIDITRVRKLSDVTKE